VLFVLHGRLKALLSGNDDLNVFAQALSSQFHVVFFYFFCNPIL